MTGPTLCFLTIRHRFYERPAPSTHPLFINILEIDHILRCGEDRWGGGKGIRGERQLPKSTVTRYSELFSSHIYQFTISGYY